MGFQNSATVVGLGFYAARSHSLRMPPRTDRRWIRSWERWATGWSGRGGRSWRLAIGASSVVVALVLGQDRPLMPLAQDQHPVSDLRPGRPADPQTRSVTHRATRRQPPDQPNPPHELGYLQNRYAPDLEEQVGHILAGIRTLRSTCPAWHGTLSSVPSRSPPFTHPGDRAAPVAGFSTHSSKTIFSARSHSSAGSPPTTKWTSP